MYTYRNPGNSVDPYIFYTYDFGQRSVLCRGGGSTTSCYSSSFQDRLGMPVGFRVSSFDVQYLPMYIVKSSANGVDSPYDVLEWVDLQKEDDNFYYTYKVYRSTRNSFESANCVSVQSGNWHVISGLESVGDYYYWVEISDGGNYKGLRSQPMKYHCEMVSPKNVSATVDTSTETVSISWSPVSGATSYVIYRDGSKVGSATSNSYVDTSATPGQLHSYRVRAYGASNRSVLSEPVQGRRWLPAPTNVTASDGTSSTSVTITWTGVSVADWYEVWRSESASDSTARYVGTAKTTSFTDTKVTPGVTYYYWVKSGRSYGKSAFGTGDSGYARQ